MMKKINRVLFVGNSITWHVSTPELGWYGDWGMAASSREKDYVHLVIEALREKNPATEFMFRNIAEYERLFWEFDITKFQDMRDFNADVIIMRIAENVDNNEAGKKDFGRYYEEIIKYLNVSGTSTVFCTNCFWDRDNVNRCIRKVADNNRYEFVNIGMVVLNDKNMAKSEYENEDVGCHPSDSGMKCIADIILSSLEEHFNA